MRKRHLLILPLALTAAACAGDAVTPTAIRPTDAQLAAATAKKSTAESIRALMENANVKAKASGATYLAAVAEYVTLDGSAEAGSEIVARNVGNKRLADDFVPFDPRRAAWSGSVAGSSDDITFAIDQTADATPPSGGTSGAAATAAIRRAMASWRNLSCAPGIGLTERSSAGEDLGLVAALNFRRVGGDFIAADVMHAGWRDLNFAGGVLGVTFTFIFVDKAGNATDIDRDGQDDVAFREIYYDPSWNWRIGANIDIESVALHEAGHGLSQAHFGNLFIRNDGFFDASPRAVMNAFYSAPLQTLLGTDEAGHCGNWQNWPNG